MLGGRKGRPLRPFLPQEPESILSASGSGFQLHFDKVPSTFKILPTFIFL